MKKLQLVLLVTLALILPAVSYGELEMALGSGEFKLANLPAYKRALALDIVKILSEENAWQILSGKMSLRHDAIELVPLCNEIKNLGLSRDCDRWCQAVTDLDKKIREIKGISDRLEYILEIRPAFPEKKIDKNVLVSYIPGGNEKSWKFVEAFDLAGNVHRLDVHQSPEQQVLVVGLNARQDMQAGLALMNEELKKAGMQYTTPVRSGIDVAKLDYIRLEDDQEPWISGDAEVYTLVNGIAPEASKANVIAMEMPYLATDKKDYYPNQVLIIWQNYRYKAANLNVYEHDDSTNYKEIVAMLIEKIGEIVPEYQFITDIASKIIRLMPDDWFTNDDDYVDVYYTLEKGKTYTNFQGVSRNAKITLVPYFIPE